MSYASDTLSIFTDCCAPHEPREQSGCASFPPSSSASPEATGSLLAVEEHATAVEQQTQMSIRIFGLDSAAGLPPRTDPRDCPFAFRGGEFRI